MKEVIKTVCDAVGDETARFKDAVDGLARAVKHEVRTKLVGEPGKVEAEYNGWNAEVQYTNTVTEDPGDRWTAPSWDIANEEYTVLDLWEEGADISAPLAYRKRLEDELNKS